MNILKNNRKIISIIILTLCMMQTYCQRNVSKYFYVQEIDTTDAKIKKLLNRKKLTENQIYKINYIKDSSDINISGYPLQNFVFDESFMDTISMIQELLQFKDDNRLCALQIQHYGAGQFGRRYVTDINGNKNYYSIQVEALFIINQLFFRNQFDYSSCPVLIDIENGDVSSVDGEIIEKTFECYENWFKRVNEVGLQYAREHNINPLDDCASINWF